MWKSCLLAIVLLVGGYIFEKQQLDALKIPFSAAMAALLTFGLTLSVLGLAGLPQTFKDWNRELSDISTWENGQLVTVTGRLRPASQTLKAPASRRDCLRYEYKAVAAGDQSSDEPPASKLWGVDACDGELVMPSGTVRVTGFAPLEKFSAASYGGDAYLPDAASFLARRKWKTTPKLSWDLLLNPATILGNEKGEWESDVATEGAKAELFDGLGAGSMSESQLLQRLRKRNWVFEERIVPPHSDVKLRGRFRAGKRVLDINFGIRESGTFIEPAVPGEKPSTNQTGALVNLALIVAGTVGLHYVFYSHRGQLFWNLLRWLEVDVR